MYLENGEVMSDKEYKSPANKLVKFFEKSKNKWREKCKEYSYNSKLQNKRIRFLESTKSALKEENAKLKKTIRELENKVIPITSTDDDKSKKKR